MYLLRTKPPQVYEAAYQSLNGLAHALLRGVNEPLQVDNVPWDARKPHHKIAIERRVADLGEQILHILGLNEETYKAVEGFDRLIRESRKPDPDACREILDKKYSLLLALQVHQRVQGPCFTPLSAPELGYNPERSLNGSEKELVYLETVLGQFARDDTPFLSETWTQVDAQATFALRRFLDSNAHATRLRTVRGELETEFGLKPKEAK